jgi:large subunit ribosomal protein L30
MINNKFSKIVIIQNRSSIGYSYKQKQTLKALGLKKINNQAIHNYTPQIAGMIKKVYHLIKIIKKNDVKN